jgi:hypothetical protein
MRHGNKKCGVATWHENTCDICGAEASVTEPRDYGHLKDTWIKAAEKHQPERTMNTDTPRTDEWETYCDESYYHLWRVRRKNERGFNDGYHVHNGEEARALVNLLNKQDSELAAARAEIAEWRILNGWGGTPEIINDFIKGQQTRIHLAQNLEEELDRVTEQRDRLAEALKAADECLEMATFSKNGYTRRVIDEALKSLTTKDHE